MGEVTFVGGQWQERWRCSGTVEHDMISTRFAVDGQLEKNEGSASQAHNLRLSLFNGVSLQRIESRVLVVCHCPGSDWRRTNTSLGSLGAVMVLLCLKVLFTRNTGTGCRLTLVFQQCMGASSGDRQGCYGCRARFLAYVTRTKPTPCVSV